MTPPAPQPLVAFPRLLIALIALLACTLPTLAAADIVTGTITPANAKVTILNSQGQVVAEPKPGAYQLQLPVGRYTARCEAPKAREQDLLVLSEPVTINIDCS